MIIDVFNYQLITPPFVSIICLILQYLADKRFYTKRYQDSSSFGVQKTKSMINALQVIPKVLILGSSFTYPAFKEFSPLYRVLWVIDICILALLFVRFESLSAFVLRKFFQIERKRKLKKIGVRTMDEEEGDKAESSGRFGDSGAVFGEEKRSLDGVKLNLNDLLLGPDNSRK